MKRKAFGLKIISFFLSVVVTVACLPATANSLNTNAVDVSTEVVEPTITDPVIIDPIFEEAKIESATLEQLTSRAPDEKTVFELQEMEVDTSSLPSFIETNYALQKGHVNRLKSAEKNLNTVVFQNKDGTETTYIFIRPVKYVDENGEVKDKSDKIAPIIHATYSYGVLNNNSKIYFPKNVTAGTKIQYQNYTIQMTPVTTYSASPTYLNETEVAYNGVFGTNTVLKYQTKLNGLKEDIVLVKNTGLNEFDFTLTLTNLTPVLIDNIWYLKNSGDEIIASLGRIIIKDSNGNSTEGSMTISPSAARNTYAVKIIVPADFLSADSTVYPVYVDPSTTIFETDSYYNEYGYLCSYNAILDTGMYTTAEAVANAEANQDYHNSSITGKIVYKLYDFYGENGQYTTLRSSQIGNAFLHINVGSGASATLTVNPMLGTWNQATYGEDPIAISDFMIWMAYSTEISSSLYLDSTGGRRSINITDIVRGWADYNNGESSVPYNNPEYGFVLSSDLTSSSRTIAAVEEFYANSVYVTLDTSNLGGSYYFANAYSGKFLKRHTLTSVNTSNYYNTDNIRWYLEYIGNDKFYIRSMYNTNYALCGSGDSVSLSYMPANPPDNYVWTISNATGGGVILKCVGCSNHVLKHDGLSLSLAVMPSSTDATYKQIVWGAVQQSNYVNLSSFTVDNLDWISVGSQKSSAITVTPSNSTYRSANWFDWQSDNTDVATVDNSGRVTGIANGSARITATHKHMDLKYTFVVSVGQLISNGTYYIQNANSHYFVDIEGASTNEGAYIQQYRYHSGSHAQWIVNYSTSGYYTLKSPHSGKYISVAGASNAAGAVVQQVASIGEASKWKISKTSSGQYKFTAVCGEVLGRVLSVPANSYTGANLIQGNYNNDTNYRDEWNLYLVDSMFSDGIGITSGEEYSLMNLNTDYYLALETDSDAAFTNVVVSSHTDADWQKWTLNQCGSFIGRFEISSLNSASGKVLNVTDNNIDINADNSLTCQQFVIRRINWAPYEGAYIIKYENSYVVADSSNNVCVSTTFSDRAVWSLKLTTKKHAHLFNFNYEGFNTTATEDAFEKSFDSIGYLTTPLTNNTAIQALYYMVNDDAVFIFRGHGGAGCLEFHNEDGSVNGYIYASSTATKENCGYIGALPENTLSDLRCVLFLGCKTGRTNKHGENLLVATYNKGAHFVLGTLDTTIVSSSNAFLRGFLEAVELNYCIEDAIQYALQNAGSNITWPSYGYVGYYPVVYIGDIYQYLN